MAIADPPPSIDVPVVVPGAGTPTGLRASELERLEDSDLRRLVEWHAGKAGSDDGRPWWPSAIRRIPLAARMRLAADPALDQAWTDRERLLVATSPRYFLVSYGHMRDEDGGPPVPFRPWPAQMDVMARFEAERLMMILKARQLGLTWLALHEAAHLMGFDPAKPNAKALALSKTERDAQKLLARTRQIFQLLPPYLAIGEDPETRGSKSSFKLLGRGRMDSLPGTPDAARSDQADLLLLDEGAFYRNGGFGATWKAALSTVGRRGRARIISTGNGPAEAPGDGQGFATLWQRSRSGEGDEEHGDQIGTVFLPASVDPRRTPAWRETEREKYLRPEEFEAEHPETEDQALAGEVGLKVYSPQGINAAESLGRELDALRAQGRIREPAGGLLGLTVDWGELCHILLIWPLEQGGMYVMAEYAPDAGPGIEPASSTRRMLAIARECQRVREPTGLRDPWPLIGAPTFDAAGIQSTKTMVTTIEGDPRLCRQFATRVRTGRQRLPTVSVAFGQYKTLGKDYLKRLFMRTANDVPHGVIAISPACPKLLRQLRGLELEDDGSGRIKKGDDHGPDALLAHAVPVALRFMGREQIADAELGG